MKLKICEYQFLSVSLSSDVIFWLVWLIWSQIILGTGACVGYSIVMPLVVSVGDAFQLLSSDVIVCVLTEWVNPSVLDRQFSN